MAQPDGNGRFDDTRLDALVDAIDNAEQRVAYFDALVRELVEGARTATDEAERDRHGQAALAASAVLTASVNELTLERLELRLEELAQMTRERVDALTEVVRAHDARAEAAIRDGHERVDALLARSDSR